MATSESVSTQAARSRSTFERIRISTTATPSLAIVAKVKPPTAYLSTWTLNKQEKSSSIVVWRMWECRGDATIRKSTPTINPLSPKGLAAMFHTDLRWGRRAHQNYKSNKSVSRRPLLLTTRDNEQSSETSALADEHAVRACGLDSP